MRLVDLLLKIYNEEYELNLKEGLIKTTPIGETVSILKKKFPNWFFRYNKDENDFEIEILKIKDGIEPEYFDKLLPLLNNLRWFISFMKIQGNWDSEMKTAINIEDKYNEKILKNSFANPKIHTIILDCEAKFDIKVNKIPVELYHITPIKYWDKIQKQGLVPRSRSKASYHPDRVFLAKTEQYAEDLGKKFYQKTGITEWAVLKIHTDLIPGEYFTLYKDPNYTDRGFYTLNNIPPQAIEKINTIQL